MRSTSSEGAKAPVPAAAAPALPVEPLALPAAEQAPVAEQVDPVPRTGKRGKPAMQLRTATPFRKAKTAKRETQKAGPGRPPRVTRH